MDQASVSEAWEFPNTRLRSGKRSKANYEEPHSDDDQQQSDEHELEESLQVQLGNESLQEGENPPSSFTTKPPPRKRRRRRNGSARNGVAQRVLLPAADTSIFNHESSAPVPTRSPVKFDVADIWEVIFGLLALKGNINLLAKFVRVNKMLAIFALRALYNDVDVAELTVDQRLGRSFSIYRSIKRGTMLPYCEVVAYINVDEMAEALSGDLSDRYELHSDLLVKRPPPNTIFRPMSYELALHRVQDYISIHAERLPKVRTLCTKSLGAPIFLPSVFSNLRCLCTHSQAIDGRAGRLMQECCPHLDSLEIVASEETDARLGQFLCALRRDSIKQFLLRMEPQGASQRDKD